MKKFSIILATVLLGLIVSRAGAVDTYWLHEPATPGDWGTGANWNNGEPDSDDHAYINNGGTAEITQAGEQCGRLDLGEGAGQSGSVILSGDGQLSANSEHIGYNGTGTFIQTGGTNTVSSDLSIGDESPSASGTYELSGTGQLWANYEHVGYDGTGTFIQTGGTHTVSSELCLGKELGSNGTYQLSGTGQLSADYEHVGYSGTGSFTQTGGTNTVSTWLSLGEKASSSGTYNLSGTGQLSAFAEVIGESGTGTFTQTGGTNTVSYHLYLGFQSLSDGTYELSGTGQLSAYREYIGHYGTGTFTQTGGTNTVSESLYLGYEASASGTYDLSGAGELLAQRQYIGYSGMGTFTQTGGTNTVSFVEDPPGYLKANMYIGYEAGSSGAFIQTGGTNTLRGTLWIAYEAGSSGTYELSGTGQLSVGQKVAVGRWGTGSFTQTGGTHTVTGDLNIGNDVGGSGTYELSGAGQLSVRSEYVGKSGTGTFTQTSGTNTPGRLFIGYGASGSGTYSLSGGQLSVVGSESLTAAIYIGTYGTGTFTHTGGTNTCGVLEVGSASGGTGSYELSGTGQIFPTSVVIGSSGTGTFTQTGGTINGVTIRLGNNFSGIGTYLLSAGQVSVWANESIGSRGTGTFIQTGGTNTITGVGAEFGGELGLGSGGIGTYELSGGQLWVDAREYVGGSAGTGTFIQTGGTNTIAGSGDYHGFGSGLYIGYGAEVGVSVGIYELSGTGQLSAYNEYVGAGTANPNLATGIFTQTGGTNTVSEGLYIGSQPGSGSGSGTYELGGGTLAAGSVYVGINGSGTLNITNAQANMTVSDLLSFGADSTFTAVPGATIHMTGSAFENENTDPTDLAGLSNLELIFEGGSADIDPFEVAGAIDGGFVDNFALGTLTLGGVDIGQIQLIDDYDNGNRGATGKECLFLHDIDINVGSTLDVYSHVLYVESDVESMLDSWIADSRLLDSTGYLDAVYFPADNWTAVVMLGDVNLDGFVDETDLSTIITYWGQSLGREFGDLNGNGIVDGPDYTEVLSYWGSGTPPEPTATPEPATLALLLAGGLALLGRRPEA